ncbi:hypothetical protein Tco_1310026 [Tanacetum coccineum]
MTDDGSMPIISNSDITDDTCVPISIIFNRFRNMGVNNTANTCGGSREMLPADAESGRVGRNVRRRLTTTESVMFGNVGRLPIAANASVSKQRKRTREDVRAAGNNQSRTSTHCRMGRCGSSSIGDTVQKTTTGSVNTLPTIDEQHPDATHITRNLDMADGGGVEAEKLAFYVVQSSNGLCSLRYVAEGRSYHIDKSVTVILSIPDRTDYERTRRRITLTLATFSLQTLCIILCHSVRRQEVWKGENSSRKTVPDKSYVEVKQKRKTSKLFSMDGLID